MKLKTLFVVNAVILGGSGICAVLLPARVCSIYGVESNAEIMMMAQYAGLGSIAVALIDWLCRNVKDSRALKGITLGFLITYAIGAIVSVQNTISGVIAFGWPIVLLYSVLAIAYAYFLFTGHLSD
jgi:hypothetical protein